MLLLGEESQIGARVVLLQNQVVVAGLYLIWILWPKIGRLLMNKKQPLTFSEFVFIIELSKIHTPLDEEKSLKILWRCFNKEISINEAVDEIEKLKISWNDDGDRKNDNT